MERSYQLRSLLGRIAAPGDARDRLIALAQLRRELDTVEAELAAEAFGAGLSWSQIGDALGISKQAAHRRHGQAAAKLDQASPGRRVRQSLLVDPAVRQAVRLARSEAEMMGAARVGTEHLLLGLLQCGDPATMRLLDGLGVTVERTRALVQPDVEATAAAPEPAHAPLAGPAPLARRVVEQALADVQERRADRFGALDLLRAVLRPDDGGAARVLALLNVDAERARAEIGRLEAAMGPRSPDEIVTPR